MKFNYHALFAMAALVALWQGVVWLTGVPGFILPSPAAVLDELVTQRKVIFSNAMITVVEVLAGLAIGTLFGVLTALAMMLFKGLREYIQPILVFTQTIPVFALAPVLTLWLGYGLASKIAMAVLIIYFPVASNFYDGLRRTDPGLLDLARVMDARPMQILFRLRLPWALPSLASGLKLAAVYAPIGAVIGEWVGASKGLGYLMLLANGRAKIDLMFAALIVLAVFTICLHKAVSLLGDYLTRKSGFPAQS